MKHLILLLLAAPFLLFAQTPKERRDNLLKNPDLPSLLKAVADDNAIIRHTAVRLLAQREDATTQLVALLKSTDPLVRRGALQALCLKNAVTVELLGDMMDDTDVNVRLIAVSQLAADKPAKGKQLEILEKTARKEKNAAVRDIASKAIWPFYRNTVLLRNRSDWDHDVKVVQDILLPAADWRFSLDENNQGHLNNWFKTDFDDSAWKTIPIAVTWEDAGFKYDGLAWYRKSFKAPSKPEKFNAVELHFESVDECAWVWLNGIYIGQHDLGTSGWQTPFSLDITKEIKWDADNVIVVRILDTAGAGGIYKPVHLQVLE